jgi:hypothetical protein
MDAKTQLLLFVGIFAVGALGFVLVQARRRKWSRRGAAAARRRADGDGATPGMYPWGVPGGLPGHHPSSDGHRQVDLDPAVRDLADPSVSGSDAGDSHIADHGSFDGGGSDSGSGGGGGGDGGGGGGD